jgi:hypothetical protein
VLRCAPLQVRSTGNLQTDKPTYFTRSKIRRNMAREMKEKWLLMLKMKQVQGLK